MLNTGWIRDLDARKLLWLILLLSLAIKLVLFLKLTVIHDDGPRFIAQAQLFSVGEFTKALSLNRGIFLYPLLISAGELVVGDFELSGKLISLFFSVLSIFPVFYLARYVFDERAALFSALLFAIVPEFNSWSVKVMREPGFLFFLSFAFFFYYRFFKNRFQIDIVLALLFVVVSCLFRPDGVLFLAFFTAYFLYDLFFVKKQKVAVVSIVVAVSLLLVLLNYQFKVIDYNNIDFYMEKFFEGGLFNYNRGLKNSIKATMYSTHFGWNHNNLIQFVSTHMRSVYLLNYISAVASLIYGATIFASLTGIVHCLKTLKNAWPLPSLLGVLSIFYYLFLLKMNYLEPRYIFSVGLIMLVFAGYGCSVAYEYLREGRLRWLGGLVILVLFVLPVADSLKEHNYQITSSRQAGLWLVEHYDTSSLKLMANNGAIPFYSGYKYHEYEHYGTLRQDRFKTIQRVALRRDVDLIGLLVTQSGLTMLPEFRKYREVARFEDEKMVSLLYERVSRSTNQGGEANTKP